MSDKSLTERVAGHPGVTLVANLIPIGTAIAGIGGGAVLAPLLAPLTGTLAANRHEARVRAELENIRTLLQAQGAAVQSISDDQYKFVCEATQTMLGTVSADKLRFLRNAISNSVSDPLSVTGNAETLARIVRDLSVTEMKFLMRRFRYEYLALGDGESTGEKLVIKNSEDEAIAFSGLTSIGLLLPGPRTWDVTFYYWSPLAAKIIALIQNPSQK